MATKQIFFADPSYIRSLMLKALPGRKAITSQDVFNVRIRAMNLMKKLQAQIGFTLIQIQ